MLVEDTEEIAVQIASPCGTDFRLVVYGDEAETVAVDEWDSSYDHMFISSPYGDFYPNTCNFTLTTYPTAQFEEEYVVSCTLEGMFLTTLLIPLIFFSRTIYLGFAWPLCRPSWLLHAVFF
jgi:hypothetical protein